MRKIINSTYLSLDGVIENPQDWPSMDSADPSGGGPSGTDIQTELLLGCDAVLLGKHTYTSFASVWQGRSGDPYTDQINAVTKYVVSTTLDAPDWQNTVVIRGDVPAEVGRIKDGPGKDIATYGFGTLARTLLDNDLLDEVRLWVHPLFVGAATGDGLLFGHAPATRLRLLDTHTLASGIVVLYYAVDREARAVSSHPTRQPGTTPSCWRNPRVSHTSQVSAILPPLSRCTEIPSTRTELPVGGIPLISATCVPVPVHRTVTWSPTEKIASMFQCPSTPSW